MKQITHLIGATEFILQSELYGAQHHSTIKSMADYAKFLKIPLTLSMFVPANAECEILKEPKKPHTYASENSSMYIDCYNRELEAYNQAKENVLFEGFEIKNNQLHLAYGNYPSRLFWVGKLSGTIEDLVRYELKLTPAALKMIYNN